MSLLPSEGQKSMFPMIEELQKELERLIKENNELRKREGNKKQTIDSSLNLYGISNSLRKDMQELVESAVIYCRTAKQLKKIRKLTAHEQGAIFILEDLLGIMKEIEMNKDLYEFN